MAGDYPLYTIGDVCYVTDGAHAKVERRDDGITYLTSKNIGHGRLLLDQSDCISAKDFERLFTNTSRAQRRPAPGDVLIGIIGTFGNAYLYKESDNFGISSAVALLRPDTSKIHPSFLYYVVTSDVFKNAHTAYKAGSVQGYTNIPTIKRLPAPVPSLNEQRAIAHILGTLDEKIDLNRRMNETLEAMARALFKAWFVDFDPVRAKAEGRDPGLPKPLADLFPDCFLDSELGEVPKDWRVGTLGDVAEHPRRGVQPSDIEAATPYIALEHMPRRSIALSEWGVADGLESNKFMFKEGEVLFGKLRPYFHKVGIAPVAGVCSTDIVVVVPRTEAWFGFVLGHVSSTSFVDYTNAGSTGTKMPRTSWSEMARYPIVVPGEKVAEAFTKSSRVAVNRIVSSIHESRILADLRDTLLPKLISGELRIPVAEKLVDGAI
jgi:type I restriction enzyme, S subunit